jgi:serine/threonine-protein kinase
MLSLRVKWAAIMALIVAVVMGLTATVITQRQYAAMMGQVSEYGESLARFIAAQNAAAVLGEEWDAVDVSVQAMLNSRNFERLLIIDGNGVVRVSSRPDQIGKPYQPASTNVVKTDQAGTSAVRYESNGESVLGFEAPVLFQGKAAGRVALGIAEEPITRVARLSIALLAVLALVTVVAVTIAMYVLTARFAKPIRLVAESMREIGKGRFDHRINEPRNDEFGELFRAFDSMAQSLHDRPGSAASDPPAHTPAPNGQAAAPTVTSAS